VNQTTPQLNSLIRHRIAHLSQIACAGLERKPARRHTATQVHVCEVGGRHDYHGESVVSDGLERIRGLASA
jgi:hypothetical protein